MIDKDGMGLDGMEEGGEVMAERKSEGKMEEVRRESEERKKSGDGGKERNDREKMRRGQKNPIMIDVPSERIYSFIAPIFISH